MYRYLAARFDTAKQATAMAASLEKFFTSYAKQKCEARPAWGRTVAAYEKRLGAEPGAVARAVEPTA